MLLSDPPGQVLSAVWGLACGAFAVIMDFHLATSNSTNYSEDPDSLVQTGVFLRLILINIFL